MSFIFTPPCTTHAIAEQFRQLVPSSLTTSIHQNYHPVSLMGVLMGGWISNSLIVSSTPTLSPTLPLRIPIFSDLEKSLTRSCPVAHI